ncbi:MAG: hypothetical protein PHG85_04995 [Candidatus Altiarchaeota archaeon]|nr:hypothetical protein [Candidatus Altiarchaeota archaeon]
MGLLDRLFGGGETEKKELSMPDIGGWLEGETARENAEIGKKARPILDEIFEVKSLMLKTTAGIGETPAGELPARLAPIVRTSKPEYVASMREILNGIEADEDIDYERLEKFRKILSERLERIAKTTFGPGRYLPLAHGDAMTEMQKSVKRLIDADRSIGEILNASRMPGIRKIRSLKDEHSKAVESKTIFYAQKEKLSRESEQLAKELARYRTEYASALNDENLAGQKRQQEEISQKKDRIASLAHERLSALNRPLRKYHKMASDEKRLQPAALIILEGYIERPVEQFMTDDTLPEILKGLEQAVREGKIDVKTPEKTLKAIEEAKNALTRPLADEYIRLMEQERQAMDEMGKSKSLERARELEAKIGRLENANAAKADELNALVKKQCELEGTLEGLSRNLAEGLDAFGVTLKTA